MSLTVNMLKTTFAEIEISEFLFSSSKIFAKTDRNIPACSVVMHAKFTFSVFTSSFLHTFVKNFTGVMCGPFIYFMHVNNIYLFH